MTEEKLRLALKEAQDKKQQGLFIWASSRIYNEMASDIVPGNKDYDYALSQISNEKEATVFVNWSGLEMAGFIAVSVHKLSSSDKFFNFVLEVCKKNYYKGPITIVSLNKLADAYYESY